MSLNQAQISEIFSSFQGEGIYLGSRQVFVRFAGCNLDCAYCDTPQSLSISKTYRLQNSPGASSFSNKNNPVDVQDLLEQVLALSKPKDTLHSVAITGGEPLLQVDFLKNFLPKLKQANLKVYLETNGTLPKRLEEIIEFVDIACLDFKLSSASGLSSYIKEHKAALEIAQLTEAFVKVVVTDKSLPTELDEVSKVIMEINPDIVLVIQPVTPHGHIKHRPSLEQLMSFYNFAGRHLKNVRVIPQVHKILGII